MSKAVLFDFYGTLADIKTDETDPLMWRGLADWLADKGVREISPEQLRRDYFVLCEEEVALHGEGFVLPVVFRQLLGEKASDETILSFAAQFRELSTISFDVRPYTDPLLTRLRSEHYRVALVSNTEAILTNYDLDRHGLRKYFDEIVLSSEVGIAKPDPEILSKALRSISVSPNHAVFVGDSLETDLRAAQALYMPCVLISSEPGAYSANRDLPVMFVRPLLDDIYAALTKLSA